MNQTLKFTILIRPCSVQHGSRAHVVGKGKFKHLRFYSDKKKNAYFLSIFEEVKHLVPKQPLEGPLETQMLFFIPRPDKSIKAEKKAFDMLPPSIRNALDLEYPDAIPLWEYGNNFGDCDNLNKGTQDALSRAGFWKNDAQIWAAHPRKFFTELNCPPRIEITITLDPEHQP